MNKKCSVGPYFETAESSFQGHSDDECEEIQRKHRLSDEVKGLSVKSSGIC